MKTDLPTFRQRDYEEVLAFAQQLMINHEVSDETQLVKLEAFDDGHYRVIFDVRYFKLKDTQDEPSKSQWNSLKKKFKRHNNNVFVFKEYGYTLCETDVKCAYLDFGFFAETK